MSAAPRNSSAIVAAACVCLFLVALALRLYGIGAADLSEDEELANGLPHISFKGLFTDIEDRPPLSFVPQKLTMLVSGRNGPFEIRLASVIEGALGVALVYLFVNRLQGPALMAGILMCLSYFHIVWSRDGRYYPMLALMSVAFVWCYWELLRYRNLWIAPLLVLVACALPATHHAGSLVLASGAVAAPVLVLRRESREWIKARQRTALGILAAACVCAVVGGVLVSGFIRNAAGQVFRGEETPTLPAFFDVTPGFLLNRLADVTEVPRPYTFLILLLLCAGLVYTLRRLPEFGALALSTLIIPFALIWLFRPKHWWHPKYFIFMVPIIHIAIAFGIAWVSKLGKSRALRTAICCIAVGAIAAPNLASTLTLLRHPQTGYQEMGALLSEWLGPDDALACTWQETWRVVRNYCRPRLPAWNAGLLDSAPTDEAFLAGVPNTWYLAAGKTDDTSHNVSALAYSGKLSRLAFYNAFLAFGPNTQRIAFGENYPGAPIAAGTLTIPPGGEARVDVLFPRAGRRAVFVGCEGGCGLSIGIADESLLALTNAGGGYAGDLDVPFGRSSLVLRNASDSATAALEYIEVVPILNEGVLEIPAWDFHALEGDHLLNTVWIDRDAHRTLVRDLRGGHTLYYRFFCAREMRATVKVSALNDAPRANQYTVILPGAMAEPACLSFSREDSSVTTAGTPPMALRRGVYTLAVQYAGLPTEELQALTRGFTIMTQERMQTAGIERVAIAPET